MRIPVPSPNGSLMSNDPPNSATYSTRLTEVRRARGWRSADLSRASGVHPSTLSKLEKGQRTLRPKYAQLLGEVLKVDSKELFAEPGTPIPRPNEDESALLPSSLPLRSDKGQGGRVEIDGRRATNVYLPHSMVEDARRFGISISAACEQGLRAAVREARAREWLAENSDAIACSNDYVEKHGLPLARYRQF